MGLRTQAWISGTVLVNSCWPVPAVASTLASSQVDNAQDVSIPINAVLPTPWPLATTILQGMHRVEGFCRWSRISARMRD